MDTPVTTRQPLRNISNITTCRKRLSDGSYKSYSSVRRPRRSLDVCFENDDCRNAFDKKIKLAKKKLGCDTNEVLLNKLLDAVLDTFDGDHRNGFQSSASSFSTSKTEPDFVCSFAKINELIALCTGRHLQVIGSEQDFHILKLSFMDPHRQMHTWESSHGLKDNYEINYRMIHAYLGSGIRAVQYEKFCEFARIGVTTKHFRKRIIGTYSQAVHNCMTNSISAAMDVEFQLSDKLQLVSDARHACRKNSYHTDFVALGYTTNRVIHYEHVTKDEERCSQKHEVRGCQLMYDKFRQRGIKVNG